MVLKIRSIHHNNLPAVKYNKIRFQMEALDAMIQDVMEINNKMDLVTFTIKITCLKCRLMYKEME